MESGCLRWAILSVLCPVPVGRPALGLWLLLILRVGSTKVGVLPLLDEG